MLRGSEPTKFENWVCIMERGTEYEIQLAHNFLKNLNIPSNILSKRDSSYSLNFGEMSMVYLYVPNEYEKEARESLSSFEDAAPDPEERSEDHEEGGLPGRSDPDPDDHVEGDPDDYNAANPDDREENPKQGDPVDHNAANPDHRKENPKQGDPDDRKEDHKEEGAHKRNNPAPDDHVEGDPEKRTNPENRGDEL